MSTDVTLNQAIAILQQEGFDVAPYAVHYMVDTGRITRPVKDGAGNYRFTPEILDEIRRVQTIRQANADRIRTRTS